jgi:hypothetical protein
MAVINLNKIGWEVGSTSSVSTQEKRQKHRKFFLIEILGNPELYYN